jgi:hypothetical protein
MTKDFLLEACQVAADGCLFFPAGDGPGGIELKREPSPRQGVQKTGMTGARNSPANSAQSDWNRRSKPRNRPARVLAPIQGTSPFR